MLLLVLLSNLKGHKKKTLTTFYKYLLLKEDLVLPRITFPNQNFAEKSYLQTHLEDQENQVNSSPNKPIF